MAQLVTDDVRDRARAGRPRGSRTTQRLAASAPVRFVAMVVAGLALLTWIAEAFVLHTTRLWSERDLIQRSHLAVNSAGAALADAWGTGDRGGVARVLSAMAIDERVMAVAACDRDGHLFATSVGYPQAGVGCDTTLDARAAGDPEQARTLVTELPGGPAHVTAVALEGVGNILVVHDLAFLSRREGRARAFLVVAFGVLAVGAALVTWMAASLAWRGWTLQLRRALRGDELRPEYLPLLEDVRELVARLSAEGDSARGGRWTAERLRSELTQELHGEKVVIVANREPYLHERRSDGTVDVVHPASGLVTALEPVMRACSGVWVAHGSGSADRETADAKGRLMVPPGNEAYMLRRVWLTAEEEQGYYYGFSNEGLWPLCHVAHTRPTFRAEDWRHYRAVNRKFADAVCQEVDSDDAIILVQDYHFALAPRMIRERLPRATILTFWHIPWPNPERIGICPWKDELIDGLLGSSIVGFHTRQHCNNFVDAVATYVEARVDREHSAIVREPRRTLVRPYPISIEWPVHWLSDLPTVEGCRREIFAELTLRDDALLGVGVDRLDYTKGIEERFLAVERLLDRSPEMRGRFTFVQLAAPSRTRIETYSQLNTIVEQTAERINVKYGRDGYSPIVLLRRHHEPAAVYRFYRAAHLCYVSSLHDGMNLVAKEFVAARDDEQGVLVLSRFTGAARELTEALIVNPYDLEQASSALLAAVRMSPAEQRERMRAMRAMVADFNVYRWAGRMLRDAADLRRRERLSGHLTRPAREPAEELPLLG